MALSDTVYVDKRFQRSIRIDTDLFEPDALKGFICPQSSAEVMVSLSTHVIETGQAAFTWTGPYGSGKSSLVIALSAITSDDMERRNLATKSIGLEYANKIWNAFPIKKKGWKTIPVVGQKSAAHPIIGQALIDSGLIKQAPESGWNDNNLIQLLKDSVENNDKYQGAILFIDEMGKFLEAAAQGDADLYLFQQLAEIANRSNGKLIVIGILHQAFADYTNRFSRGLRDEWSKIQGRFIDLTVNTAGEEQIDLLARAINSDHKPINPSQAALITARTISENRPGVSDNLALLLEKTWPLHPIVTALLGPISRRRFGQNQRSLFGFLNSAEPKGFQDHLRYALGKELYLPNQLWDYLRINLEPSIIASPDGHRWAIASEALDRCEAQDGSELELNLLKTIAILDLFRDRSGLVPNQALLHTAILENSELIDKALRKLQEKSFIIYRKYLDSYAIFAGSDFDIESALEKALDSTQEVDLKVLQRLASLQPILAKRYYFKTGSLRWFDINICSLNDINAKDNLEKNKSDSIGLLQLALPTQNESLEIAYQLCQKASQEIQLKQFSIIIGYPKQAWRIIELAKELRALESIQETHAEIQGDQVAQRELNTRLISIQNQLELELQGSFLQSQWFEKGQELPLMDLSAINSKISNIADTLYPHTPKISNELLNRTKPSSSATAAQNALLRAMANNIGEERLGIKGFPAEGGLFESILYHTGLYQKTKGEFDFISPLPGNDPANLYPSWQVATQLLLENSQRSVSLLEIFEAWEQNGIGMKRGLMPTLSVAFILSQRHQLAFYREGIFQAVFTDLDVDYLSKDPASIQVRWMDLSHLSKELLSGLAELVRLLDGNNPLTELEPIDVAKGLIAVFDRLPNWTQRTQKISSKTVKLRTIFKHANDPNQLLFSDLPNAYEKGLIVNSSEEAKAVVDLVSDVMHELVNAYPNMLQVLSSTLLTELQVPNNSPQALLDLNNRAKNIQQISGDFRLEAFSNRVSHFNNTTQAIEGIASLAANKPPKDWVDSDLNKALIEIAELAQKFIRVETYARVQNRKENRKSIAIIVSQNGTPLPLEADFHITQNEQKEVDKLLQQLKNHLSETEHTNIVLAALAQLSSEYMQPINKPKSQITPQGE